jgi:coenzyme F420 hydrogenase subunit beta
LIDTAVLSGTEDPMSPVGVAVTGDRETNQSSKSRFVVTPNLAKFNEVVQGKAKSVGIVATPCQTLALLKMRNSKHRRIRENTEKLSLVIGLFCGWALSSLAIKDLLSKKVELGSIVGMDIPSQVSYP